MPSCFMLFWQAARLADSRTRCTAGTSNAIKTAMMAITTKSSIVRLYFTDQGTVLVELGRKRFASFLGQDALGFRRVLNHRLEFLNGAQLHAIGADDDALLARDV